MRYVILPKLDALESPDPARVEMSVAARRAARERRDTVFETSARRSDPLRSRDAFESARRDLGRAGDSVRLIAAPDRETRATQVTIVEADREGAEALARELGAEVVADEELPLIEPRPRADVAGRADELADENLWHLEAIGLTRARTVGFGGTGNGVTVAVLDTGIADVPEVAGKVVRAVALDPESGTANDLGQTVDTQGHGTHVAGLIAGSTVGVAPGAALANVVMLPEGRGSLSRYALALEWVAAQPDIAIVNMSAGKPGFIPFMRLMARIHRRLHTAVFIAIGNEGAATSRSPGNYPEVVSVGAANAARGIWEFSGGEAIDVDGTTISQPKLVAPGEDVTSCIMAGGYASWDGTSMATPIVAGIAALMLERFPDITLGALEQELIGACVDLGHAATRQGRGLIQLPPRLVA